MSKRGHRDLSAMHVLLTDACAGSHRERRGTRMLHNIWGSPKNLVDTFRVKNEMLGRVHHFSARLPRHPSSSAHKTINRIPWEDQERDNIGSEVYMPKGVGKMKVTIR